MPHPNGVALTSENAYDGVLAVTGALPFLAIVSLEGVLPTAVSGAVMYGCGNYNVAMISEDVLLNSALTTELSTGALGLGYNRFAGPLGFVAGYIGPAYGMVSTPV